MTAMQNYVRLVRRLGPRIKRALASAGIRLNAAPTTRKAVYETEGKPGRN